MQTKLLGAFLLLALCSFAVNWFVGLFTSLALILVWTLVWYYITRPLERFTKISKQIAGGDLTRRISIMEGGELDELAGSFNKMLDKIAEDDKTLQVKVDERGKAATRAGELLQRQSTELKTALESVSMFAAKTDEQKTLYALMLASIGDAVFVADKDRAITVVNRAAVELLSYKEEELSGKPIDDIVRLVKQDENEPLADIWDRAMQSDGVISLQVDMNVLDKKGAPIPVSATISPIINKLKERTGIIVALRNIREERNLEETRISFISVASHQLRTPLTSMRWFAEMLLAGDAGALAEDQKHFIERIYEGTDRMINLVNLLLQIARVEARRVKIEPAPTDLKQTTKGVALSLKANLDAKEQLVEITSDPEAFPQILLDPDIIWQIIQNLLSNASRYSPQKATISVHIAQREHDIEYSVSDKGIGIPEGDREKIFEKFYRAENALRYVPEGSGLGLSLVKSLVEGWGGKIWFKSKEGEGTTFFFTIPQGGMQKRAGDVSITV